MTDNVPETLFPDEWTLPHGSSPAGNGQAPHQPNYSRFAPDPPCFHCDKPVVGKHRDERGRYTHHECERNAAAEANR